MFKKCQVSVKEPITGLQTRGWVLLTAVKNLDSLIDEKEREIKKMQMDLADALGRASMAESQVAVLLPRVQRAEGMAEKAAFCIVKVNAKKKRRPDVAKIKAFVAAVNVHEWDPEKWDGNIWDDDYEDDDGPDAGSVIDPLPLQAKPVTRRRLFTDAQGNVRRGDVFEDYTAQEREGFRSRYAQGRNEPVDTWLVRLHDAGAGHVSLDKGDGTEFTDYAVDPRFKQAMRQELTKLEGDSTLMALAANAAYEIYPHPQNWPEVKPWTTLQQAIRVVRELAMRDAVVAGQADQLDVFPFTSIARTILIKTAPANLKGIIMTLLLNEVGAGVREVVAKLRDLGDLGEWGGAPPGTAATQRTGATSRDSAYRTGGVNRKELWGALINAKVPKEEIDGQPTGLLLDRAKKKGLIDKSGGIKKRVAKVEVHSLLTFAEWEKLSKKLDEVLTFAEWEKLSKKRDETGPSSSSESSSEEEEEEDREKNRRKSKHKKGGKKRKGKNKGRSLYPVEELERAARDC
uniref:Uncharacterized protein n=1 Tax=Erpetoichthys calabaricus TaxID=27687 RepID=A0A8C4SG01_ERPCA